MWVQNKIIECSQTEADFELYCTGIRTTLPPESQATVGSLPGKRVLVILSRYLRASVFILRGNEGEGWISGPSKKYPVVVVFLG